MNKLVTFIALVVKGIDYEYRGTNLLKDEQYSEAFLKINPMAQVPAFIVDNTILTQSMAIIEYLEETKPDPPLLPKDVVLKAKVRAICECIGAGIQPIQNTSVILKLSPDKDQQMSWASFWITKGFKAVETFLEETAGKYCVGDSLTIADCFLVPQVYNAKRFNVDLTPFPNINRVMASLNEMEAIQSSHPSKQPDTPENFR